MALYQERLKVDFSDIKAQFKSLVYLESRLGLVWANHAIHESRFGNAMFKVLLSPSRSIFYNYLQKLCASMTSAARLQSGSEWDKNPESRKTLTKWDSSSRRKADLKISKWLQN